MNVFTTGLSPRLPIIQPLAQCAIHKRPVYHIWTDASGQGYGAHLGHAKNPIALFQHKSLHHIHLLPPSASHPIDLPANNPQIQEAVSSYLCLHHWRSFLRGSKVKVHVDNLAVCQIHSGKSKGRGVVGVKMNAIKELVKTENMVLEVKWLQGIHNRLADGLSRWVSTNSSKYSSAAKLMMQKHGQVIPTYLEAGGLVWRGTQTWSSHRQKPQAEREGRSGGRRRSLPQTHKAGTLDLGYGKMGGEWTNISHGVI